MRVDEFIELSVNQKSLEGLLSLYQEAVASHGYDQLVYTLVTDHPSINKPARHGVMFTYPQDWMDYYLEHEYDKYDPVIRSAATASRPFLWDNMCARARLTKLQKKIMNEAGEAKLYDGLCIPIFGPPNEIAGVGLASKSGKVSPDLLTIYILRAITYHFHALYCEHEAVETTFKEPVQLSPREREILTWLSEGKSQSVVAELLGIDINTVTTHLRRAYAKLGASEKTMAVVKAIRLGLISPYRVA